jgi:hypothetical protein
VKPYLLLIDALVMLTGLLFGQQHDAPRQKFSERWFYNSEQKLFFKTFLFKVNASDPGYTGSQTIVFDPAASRDFVFWFSNSTGRYWARCPTGYHPEYGAAVGRGDVFFQLLPVEFQRKELKSIDFAKFTPTIDRRDHPTLPGSADKVRIEVLPLDKKHLPVMEK